MSAVIAIWQKLEQWILTNAPELHETLQAGASNQKIAQLEQQLGVTLPEDYKTFLNLCDGQSDESAAGFYGGKLLSVQSVGSKWDRRKKQLDNNAFEGIDSEPDKGVRDDWWNPRWIPFTHDEGGNHLCLDLEPTNGGTIGQVITWWYASSDRGLRFPNFTARLESVLNGIQAGEIVFDTEEYNALVDADDLA